MRFRDDVTDEPSWQGEGTPLPTRRVGPVQEPTGHAARERLRDLEEFRRRIEADLRVAEQVHRSLIPRSGRQGLLDVACHFDPTDGIGGDYASVFFQSPTRVVASVCDVSGHGIASALLASRVNSFVLRAASTAEHPCEVGDSLNAFVCDNFQESGLLLTFFCLFLDLEMRCLQYSGFGHPPVLLAGRDGAVRRIDSENPIIGVGRDLTRHCSMLNVPFEPGDRLVLYTDGVTETEDTTGEFLGVEGLERLIRETVHLPANDAVAALCERVDAFGGGRSPADDRLLLALDLVDDAEV
jgi:sigma-B regulation protein RsbU (phosphoserine phosphatase)